MNSIRLFPSNATEFNTNGIGNLTRDIIDPSVTHEINGEYYLEFDYPCSGLHYEDIELRSIIVSKPDPYSSPQAFRVSEISLPLNGQVTVTADHISQDLSGITLKAPPLPSTAAPDVPGSFSGCKAAFSWIQNGNALPSLGRFTFSTEITDSKELSMPEPMTIRAFLGGDADNSILNLYGGEFEFDNFNVRHKKNIGYDRGVVIRYGKNLADFNQDSSNTDQITGYYPYYYNSSDGFNDGSVQYFLNDAGQKAYSYDKVQPLDCSSVDWSEEGYGDYDGMPTSDMMNTYAKKMIKEVGLPTVSTKISFIELSKLGTANSEISEFEKIHIGDLVTVIFSKINCSLKSECIKTVYDAKTDKYTDLTLGDPINTLSKTIFMQNSNTAKMIAKAKDSIQVNTVSKSNIINAINASSEDVKIAADRFVKQILTGTLSSSGWNKDTLAQTISITGADSDSAITPVSSSESMYKSCGVTVNSVSGSSFTFKCTTVPSADLTVKAT